MRLFKFILTVLVLVGWVSMALADAPVVVQGKNIKMDYTLTVNNEVLESSVGKQPLEFVFGDRSIIPGLEKGIEGMKVGEEKMVTVEPKEGYGEVDPKGFKEFPKDKMPSNAPMKVGMVLEAQAPDGENFPAVISEIKKDTVVLDFNHPLAGKTLSFKIKILDITETPVVPKPAEAIAAQSMSKEIAPGK